MSDVLARWNRLAGAAAFEEILPCCGSRAWADGMVSSRPLSDQATLMAASDEIWRGLAEPEWLEAFHSHPRIGESGIGESGVGETVTPQPTGAQSAAWSAQEQRKAASAGGAVRIALAEANREYERRFNHIFIVCATGKSGAEILEILRRRMKNDSATELREAAEQQRQITQIRLEKWLLMKRISTHVLDTTRGAPAKDVPVRLERQEASGNWTLLAAARTDHDGRCGQLLPENEVLVRGFYRLRFDTASYFATLKINALYPLVEITFQVREGESHFHIPLLLSPNGYTTYRGS